MSINRDTFDECMVPSYAPADFIPLEGKAAKLWDQNGKDYIDFGAGIAVNALGHSHPDLVETLNDQGKRLWHLSNMYTNEPALRLAQQLCSATFAEKVFFTNSGAEANEAALKLARKYASQQADDKHEIIAFNNAFHGRTLFTVTAGGQRKYTAGFEPLPTGFHHVPFNDIAAFEQVISNKTCAVILEPVQGEGGIRPATPEFLQALRSACDKYNALLIFDEVQTGNGRTGELYAYMHYGIEPDILTTAKALGCGFPIGAMLTTTEKAQSLSIGTHGTTCGGNPLACAVASKAFELISHPDLLIGIEVRRQWFIEALQELDARHDFIQEIRGLGLLIGVELKQSASAQKLLRAAQVSGLLLLTSGSDIIRLAPPLNINQAEIKEGFKRFDKALSSL